MVTGALLLVSPGCSYAFVRGPSPSHQGTSSSEQVQAGTAPGCTSSNAVPILDTILGVALIGFGVTSVVVGSSGGGGTACPNTGCTGSFSPNPAVVLGVGVASAALGGLFLGSGVSGFGRTADCRSAPEQPSRVVIESRPP